MTEAVRPDAGTPNETAIPPSSTWYHEYTRFGHDPDRARRLLGEAGVRNLTIDLMVSSDFPETITAAEAIRDQLGEVGITVELRREEFRAWLADQAAGDFDAFLLRWIGNIHPDDFHHAQHHSQGVNNFQGFSDPEVDDLLDAARRATDEATRRQAYADAAERIVDQASYIHLYNADVVEAWLPRVHGYETRPDGATRFGDVRLG